MIQNCHTIFSYRGSQILALGIQPSHNSRLPKVEAHITDNIFSLNFHIDYLIFLSFCTEQMFTEKYPSAFMTTLTAILVYAKFKFTDCYLKKAQNNKPNQTKKPPQVSDFDLSYIRGEELCALIWRIDVLFLLHRLYLSAIVIVAFLFLSGLDIEHYCKTA